MREPLAKRPETASGPASLGTGAAGLAPPDTPDVFFVPHADRVLLHAPLQGLTALINRDAAQGVRDGLLGHAGQSHPKPIAALIERLRRPAVRPPIARGDYSPRLLSLLPTTHCNLHCRYCGPGADPSHAADLSPERCEQALRAYATLARQRGYRSFSLYYFGGEPFLGWEIVQQCDRLGRQLAEALQIPFQAMATTNGVMSEEHALWVSRHLSYVVVSLDGPPEIQDRNRPTRGGRPTYDGVERTLRIFQREGLPYTLRCTVDRDSVGDLVETVGYLTRRFRPHRLNIEPVLPHGRCAANAVAPPSTGDFVRGVIEAARVAAARDVPLKLSTAQPERLEHSYCGLTQDNCVITPDGGLSTCYSVNHAASQDADPYLIGQLAEHGGWRIDPERLAAVRALGVEGLPRCRDCFCKWHCGGGCRRFHTPPGCTVPPDALCHTTRLLTRWRLLSHLRLHDAAARVMDEAGGDDAGT